MKKFLLGAFTALTAVLALNAQSRKVDVWDFGGVAENGAANHISIADIDKIENLAGDGKFAAGDVTFGDMTLRTEKNDRAYYEGAKNYGVQGYTSFEFEDGYTSNGLYYCNGKGGESKRYMLLKNVQAGDTVTFYARLSNSGDEKIHFASVEADGSVNGKQDESAPLTSVAVKYEYVASVSGSYKVFAEANVGKPVYYRIKRTPGVEVSGTLASPVLVKDAALKFVNQTTKQEIAGIISGKSYKAGLAAGFKYTAVLTGVKGYGISAQTKTVEIAEGTKGAVKADLTVAEQKTYVVSGKLKGIAADYQCQDMTVEMTVPKGSVYLPVVIPCTKEGDSWTFKGELEPSVAYTAVLKGGFDYEITGEAEFNSSSNLVKDVTCQLKPVYEVSGKFSGETKNLPAGIKFQNLDDGYVYKGSVKGDAFSAKLRDGNYQVVAETESAATMNHVVVKGKAVSKNIKLSLKNKNESPLTLKKDIYVGGKKADYASVKEAVAAAARMNPKSEADRITIHIAPGVYRSQLIIATPYITLKNDDPSKEVKLTWYYGIGYNYYSADAKGFYDEDRAYDKFEKKGVARWGTATQLLKTAKHFKAEGITFETSFNKYVTDEEIADGVESDGSQPFVRKLNSDVRSKKATERSAALCSEADDAEFFKCKFLGLQDTLYTGSETRQYFRNCFIEGNTDFIFGDGDAVFENCEIRWCGYTDIKVAGYLTAARKTTVKGYLFYNCVVSADTSVKQNPGVFGRPWGPDATVAFVNTVLGTDSVIDPLGWMDMNGNLPQKAHFAEFNTLWDGKQVPVKERNGGKVLTSEKGYTPADYFNAVAFNPVYYSAPKGEDAKLKKLAFTTDDDINTPYPGHTITLHYSLGKLDSEDISLIQWYRVKDGKEILVKQSAGYADKTYLLTKDDTGAIIKAVVTPQLRGGKPGKAVSQKLSAKINEGYSVPAKADASRPRAEGKVNVFLAGDSTVKDYSAEGMWNGGKTRNEGAWGEFIQSFFNNTVSIQNYANGGRSTRNFINEGSLDKIAANISKGDYLFIQFGHNDCSQDSGNIEDRYIPVGEPDSKGIYPCTPGKKVPTPASYRDKYGDEFYSYDCGGTYKWFLKQYIDVARKAGATPVLVTPVSRVKFGNGGIISPHHFDKPVMVKGKKTYVNSYCEAVKQLAAEEKVLCIDGFELTKALYEKTFKETGDSTTVYELMFLKDATTRDSTHNNKLGGFAVAAEFAKAIKAQVPGLSKSIVHPAKVIGENSDGSLMFTVSSEGKIQCDNEYWQKNIQAMIDRF